MEPSTDMLGYELSLIRTHDYLVIYMIVMPCVDADHAT